MSIDIQTCAVLMGGAIATCVIFMGLFLSHEITPNILSRKTEKIPYSDGTRTYLLF